MLSVMSISQEHAFVDRMGGALAAAGLPAMPARVFAALLVDDDGKMTSAELAAGLEVSPAGVSGAVRYLARLGMLHRTRERGSRRDVYVVDDDAWHEAMVRSDQSYRPMLAALTAAVDELGPGHPAHRRLVLTREFLLFLESELRALGPRWEARRAEVERELSAE